MPLGNEKRHRRATPEEAKARLAVIQGERDRLRKEQEEKKESKMNEVNDYLQRRKKGLPNPPETRKVELPQLQSKQINFSGLEILISKKTSNRVFIVCGGESINGLDLSLLENENTISVNRSFFKVPNPTFFLSMDNTFYGKISQEEKNKLIETNTHKIFIANFASGELEEKNGVIWDPKNRVEYTLSFYNSIIKANGKNKIGNSIDEFFTGINSGFCAIQLAILMRYEEIYLLGMDLIANKLTHFHGGYGEQVLNFNTKLKKYQDLVIPVIEEYNSRRNNSSKIISCSPISTLNTILEYKDFKDIIFNQEKEMNTNLDDLMVVGYYTINTPYEKEAQKTIRSCVALGLNHDFLGISNLGSWQANTRYKAQFMIDMLDKHKGKKLLYVDCDAIIRSVPSLFANYNCDVAVRYQDFRWRKNECLSGTIYMENNIKTRKLCEIWLNTNISEGKDAGTFEQWNLGSAIQEMIKTDGLNFKNLPPEYTFIFDTMKQIYPDIKPVIEHFQASRQFKNKI